MTQVTIEDPILNSPYDEPTREVKCGIIDPLSVLARRRLIR
jgi:hypothetical protein